MFSLPLILIYVLRKFYMIAWEIIQWKFHIIFYLILICFGTSRNAAVIKTWKPESIHVWFRYIFIFVGFSVTVRYLILLSIPVLNSAIDNFGFIFTNYIFLSNLWSLMVIDLDLSSCWASLMNFLILRYNFWNIFTTNMFSVLTSA